MPNVSRPDLLPLARVVRVGLPFHGQVTNGALKLPDSSTMTYTQPTGTDLTWVEHPLAATPTRTAEEIAHDTAHNYQWLDYAYVSGEKNEIGAQQLGDHAWLYCSATRTWWCKVELTEAGADKTLTVSAREFGRLGVDASSWAVVGTHTYTQLDFDDVSLAGAVLFGKLTHSKTGAVTVVNMGSNNAAFDPSFGFAGAIKITLSGDSAVTAAFIDLCLGSQIGTADLVDETVDMPYDYGGVDRLWPPYGCVDYSDYPGPPTAWPILRASCDGYEYDSSHQRSDYTYYAPDAGDYAAHDYDYADVAVRVYYYVTGDGTVDSFTASYWNGFRSVRELSVWAGSNSGYCDLTFPSTVTSSASVQEVTTYSDDGKSGLELTIGSLSLQIKEDFAKAGSVTQTLEWNDPALCESGGDHAGIPGQTDLLCNPGITTVFSGGYLPEWTALEEGTVGRSDIAPDIRVYNNNIVDVYVRLGSAVYTYHYVCSITIAGTLFSRLDERLETGEYILLPAVYDQRTDTVVLASDPDDDISLV